MFVGTNGSILQGEVQDGTPVTENLMAGGELIYLFGFGTSNLVATTDGTNADPSKIVFEMELHPDGTVLANDLYDIEMLQVIDNLANVEFGDVTASPASGNPLTLVVNDIGGSTIDALFRGFEGAVQTTVNVSGAGAGVGTGQDFDFDGGVSDIMQISLFEDGDADDFIDPGEAITANNFEFIMNQNNSPNDDGDLAVHVFNELGSEVQITGILINDVAFDFTDPTDTIPSNDDNGDVSFVADGLGYILHGLGGGTAGKQNDNDSVTIIADGGYHRIEITALGDDANKDTFDILLGSIAVPSPYDITFDVAAALSDEDGDMSAAVDLDVTLDYDGVV